MMLLDLPDLARPIADDETLTSTLRTLAAREREVIAEFDRRRLYLPAGFPSLFAWLTESRCTFVSDDGRRCDETHRLELHHEIPFARGGPSTVANVRLLCTHHNDLLARRDYGDDHMDRFTRRPGSAVAATKGHDGHHEEDGGAGGRASPGGGAAATELLGRAGAGVG
jgi:hypothetical protein